MIVECPRCNARYRVDDELLRDDPTFKCSRCTHLFGYSEIVEAPPAPEIEDVAAPTPNVPGLKFDAPPKANEPAKLPTEAPKVEIDANDGEPEEAPEEAPEEEPEAEPEPEPPPVEDSSAEPLAAPAAEPSPPAEAAESDFRFDRDEALSGNRAPIQSDLFGDDPGPSQIEEEADPFDELDLDAMDSDEDDDDSPTGAERIDQPRFVRAAVERHEASPAGSVDWAVFGSLALVLVVFANASLFLRNHTDIAVNALAWIPVVGARISEDRLMQTRVSLEDVSGGLRHTRNKKPVIVVSGRALNTTDAPLRRIRIEGILYDSAGDELARSVGYLGGPLSAEIVESMSDATLAVIGANAPLDRFTLEAGAEHDFSVVFVAPPADVAEVSVVVESALVG